MRQAPGIGEASLTTKFPSNDAARMGGVAWRPESLPSPPRLVITKPPTLQGSPPARQWIVRDWLPCGFVTGLYGDGGLGKSLLAQQLQSSTATGLPWLGLSVETVTSLGVYCEDSPNELWRRQDDIDRGYGVDRDALENVHWLPRLGEDNLLMTFSRSGVGEVTAFHTQLITAALDLKARLVVVDTAADTFGGNENDRSHVRQFVSRALGSIALRIAGAVLLCAHPSRAGLKGGEGDSGSTGWSNAFRSRLYLREPTSEDGEQKDPNARVLERRKANYAARNDEIRLRWREGVIEPERPDTPGVTAFGKVDAADVFIGLVREFESQARPISQNNQAGNYAPRVFGRLPREQRHDYCERDFKMAMEFLFKNRLIENVAYGRKSDERRKIIIAAAGAT